MSTTNNPRPVKGDDQFQTKEGGIAEPLLVDIDCLFDTRLSVISELWPDPNEIGFDPDSYEIRKSDFLVDFCSKATKEDQARFDEKWESRGMEVFRNGVEMTGCFLTLVRMAETALTGRVSRPVWPEYEMVVNLYPYPFDDEVEKEALLVGLSERFDAVEAIEFVSIPHEEMTPATLKPFSQVIIYDFNRWLSFHVEDLPKNPIPKTRFVYPFKLSTPDPGNVDIDKLFRENRSIFSSVFPVEMLPLKEFSVASDFLEEVLLHYASEQEESKQEGSKVSEKARAPVDGFDEW